MNSNRWPTCLIVMSALAMSAGGCASALPRYPEMPVRQSLDVIADRLEGVQTVSSTCTITLTDADGQTVRLDGALAASPPDRLRLRAWKFGRAAFDCTLVNGELWVVMPDEGRGADAGAETSPGVNTDWASRLMVFIDPAFFRGAEVAEEQSAPDVLTVRSAPGGGSTPDLLCEIERSTLTPRRFTMPGAPGISREIILSDYQLIGETPWPGRIEVLAPEGSVSIRLESTELNAPIAEGAFTPPRRAVRQP